VLDAHRERPAGLPQAAGSTPPAPGRPLEVSHALHTDAAACGRTHHRLQFNPMTFDCLRCLALPHAVSPWTVR
jgi:hypothetical protein